MLAAHLPVVLASGNVVVFALLSCVEWRVHSPLLIAALIALNLCMIVLLRFFLAFRHRADVSMRCFVILLVAGAADLWLSYGPAPAALVIVPSCSVLLVCDLFARFLWARSAKIPARRLMNAYTAVALLYFVPVANLMADHTLMGTIGFDCVNEKCSRSLRPGRAYEINVEHYRGPIAQTQADGADPRILFLGDSATFGFAVRSHDAFPARTRDWLREHGYPNAEVLNAGVPGNTEANNIVRYHEFSSWRPTHVFIMGGWHFRIPGQTLEVPEMMSRLYPLRGLMFLVLLMSSQAIADELDPRERSLDLWTQTMTDLIGRIRQDGGVPVLLEYPAPDTDQGILDSESRIAESHGIAFIRLRDRLAASPERALMFDRLHPNVVGHRLIAEAIAEWFEAGQPVAERIAAE